MPNQGDFAPATKVDMRKLIDSIMKRHIEDLLRRVETIFKRLTEEYIRSLRNSE